ncbi:MAG: RpiB/LacA/LacB family sugar-phosphate isomerase, partial [Deltaproteobacteria bacterium]|nr:RpiB/LacA/LacB family sugar-phosphate isomerase [Deltaproteobacteria bacterium]
PLRSRGHEVADLGTDDPGRSVDYPDFAFAVARAVGSGEADLGVLTCGTGIGMSIAANKVRGVRAALCHDVTTARLAREHNDANVFVVGARLIGVPLAMELLDAFLAAGFEPRHQRRLDLIAREEGGGPR